MNRISFLIGSLGGGGAERVCVTLANGLSQRGWDIEVVVLHLKGSVFHNQLSPDIQLTVLNVSHARYAVFKLAKYILTRRPKDFLVFDHPLAILLVLLRVFLPIHYQIMARNINNLGQESQQSSSFWYKNIVIKMTKIFYGLVDQVIAQSQGMADDLIRCNFVKKHKVVVINNPVNPTIERRARKLKYSNSFPGKSNYILCVGRLEAQKSFDYAIRAFSKILPDFPHLRLKIVGTGRLLASLKALTLELGINDWVDYEGFQENIIPYYLKAKVTVLTSLYEGFPNILIESITLGVPVVAFDCHSGPSEIICSGVNGFLARDGDIEDLTRLIRVSLQRQWVREDIMASAKKYQSEAVLNLYEDVLVAQS